MPESPLIARMNSFRFKYIPDHLDYISSYFKQRTLDTIRAFSSVKTSIRNKTPKLYIACSEEDKTKIWLSSLGPHLVRECLGGRTCDLLCIMGDRAVPGTSWNLIIDFLLGAPLTTHSYFWIFIKSMNTETLEHAKHCSWWWGYSSYRNKKFLPSWSL